MQEKLEFKVLDRDGKLMGSGPTVEEAIAAAAAKLSLPWQRDSDAPSAIEIVRSFIDGGEYELELP